MNIIKTTQLERLDLDVLRQTIAGRVYDPADEGYETYRRIWNGMIDRRPALIVRCTRVDDVRAGLRFAVSEGLPVSVRGGGHNVAGTSVCDGGVVLDLAPMKQVDVDPERRRVCVQAGATIGDLDRATQAYGLAVPLGVVTETGIAGLTLGGGLGWMRRKHGLSCDALRSVDIILADGSLVHADEQDHADLFWAVRGGGGNFGIVVSFEYELYEVGPDVFMTIVIYPVSEARRVLQFVRDYARTAPEAFSPIGFLTHVPPLDEIPAARHGEPCLFVVGPYIGPVEEGERELAPLRTLADPVADFSSRTTYLEVQQFFDADYPKGERYFWKSINLEELSDAVIDRLIAINDDAPSAHSTIDLWFQGGAMSRVEAGATAFGDRSAPVLIGIEANWHDPAMDQVNVRWARNCFETMLPYSDGRMYLNFPGLEGETERLLKSTYGGNYERLAALKRVYDPDNRFRTHQNIRPAENQPVVHSPA